MLKKLTRITFYGIAFSLLLWQSLLAQSRDEVANVIARLDREIARVEEMARAYDSDQRREVTERIEGAKKLRMEAVSNAQSGNLLQAAAKVKAAFLLLDQAKKLIFEGPIRRMRSQLEELLRRADDIVTRSKHNEAQRILNEAKKNRDAAEQAVRGILVDKAVEHYRVGITLANKAISLVSQSGRDHLDRIVDEKRKFEALLDKARDVVERSDNQRASQILHQAINMAKNAEEAVHNGNLDVAKRLLNQSYLLLLRAMDLAAGVSPGAVSQAEVSLSRLRDIQQAVRPLVMRSANSRAKLLFERAQRFVSDAERAVQQGRSYEALWKIDLAEKMFGRARRLTQDQNPRRFSGRIAAEIENTKSDIADAYANLSIDSPKDAEVLLKMSQFAIQKAEQAFAAGFKRLALEAILGSQRFLTQAEKVLSSSGTTSVAHDQVQLKLNQLDSAIAESEEKIMSQGSDLNRQLLRSAKEIRKLSETSLQQGNYKAANEGIQVSFELLRKSLKNIRRN